ncbi:CMP-N-acetylneuraminate-beta-1,4-galactoside alpha-2,3-sialyltransferase isoform X2 [Heteronotia binoei]|uniref:CMP-N-acetylneuraminate-beta-1,4-galactoside alpha-2,3-sialyltransferase isoform X2 n=1 Tax=Heteronotia binoei TaxID=13085 RepID=UPI002930E1D9|nr:CMP-N-acetylneuraminate-beta-1,4-galactoside alpha-2,3-sialyltransferase isoform X2 [Heteronotia binoei]
MGLLVFMRNLLLALCLFLVLGFLYYSAWKLHLLRWEDSNSVVLSSDSVGRSIGSEYDKLGFLLKLDSKLPPELASKYANISDGVCKPGYASALMTAIFPKFSRPAPMFLDDSFRKWARIRDFVPPFGIKGQDNLIKAILSVTKDYRLTPALDSLSCRRCIIVGNGGILANKSLGLKIDDYDIVIRLNSAPVKGFEKDVGGKTTLRITYPEGAIQKPEQYEKDSLFVLAGFKWQDFKWLKYIVYKEKVSASDGFWKSVATQVPREPHEIRILNPYFIQEAAFSFIGLPFNNGLMGRGNIPTLGSVAITMVLHNCDEVAVAGFGYDMNSPNAPLHYYENIKMSAIKEEQGLWRAITLLSLFAGAITATPQTWHHNQMLGAASNENVDTASLASLEENSKEAPSLAAWGHWHGDNMTLQGLSSSELLRAERSPSGSSRGKKGSNKERRKNRNRHCRLHSLTVKVQDLGLGFESEEIVRFSYCAGSCDSVRTNYDLTLQNLVEIDILMRDKHLSSNPCCRPVRYEVVSFMDAQNAWHTVDNLSAAECRCVG